MPTQRLFCQGLTIVEGLIAIAAASTLSGVFWLIYHDHGWMGVTQLVGIILVIILLAILDAIGQKRKAAQEEQVRKNQELEQTEKTSGMVKNSLNLSQDDAIAAARQHIAKCYPGACIDEDNIHPYAYGWIIGFGIPSESSNGTPPLLEPLIPGPACLYFNKHTGRLDDHDSTHDWMLEPEEIK